MKMFYTAEYLEKEIARKEKELQELKREAEGARVRDFFWHIHDCFDLQDLDFLNAKWEISFMGKTVTLYNMAEVFEGIECTLINYMEDDGIEYKREG